MTNQGFQAPAGYQEQSTDVIGVWNMEGPIHFIPSGCRLVDSSIDASKVSLLVVGKLVDACNFIVDGEEATVPAEPGKMVGVWAKPGMAALAGLAGVPVFMYLTGERDVGKASPMKTFAVMSKGPGNRLPVLSDTRTKSRSARDPLGLTTDHRGQPVADDDDEPKKPAAGKDIPEGDVPF